MSKTTNTNRSFFIALSLVLASVALIYLLYICVPCRTLARYYLIYYSFLFIIAAIPLVVLKKLEWSVDRFGIFIWFIFMAGLALYFSGGNEPNILSLASDLLTGQFLADKAKYTLFSLAAYTGLVYLFYFGVEIVYPELFDHPNQKIKMKTFGVWNAVYLLYINAMISILNPFFSRPF